MVLAGGGSFRTTKPSLHTTTNAGIIQRFLPVPIRLDQDGELAWRVPFRNSGRIHSRLRPQPQEVLCRNDGCVGLRCQRLSDHSADNASAIRSSSSPAVWGVNGLPFHLFVFTSESLDKGELHPAVAGGTAATIFAGGHSWAGRNLHPFCAAGGEHLHLPAADVDDQNSPAIGLPLAVRHSVWQDRLCHRLAHHFLAEKRWTI
jgi:hypothetical protein